MRDYKLHAKEYLDYLKFLQKEIYKILPLYERFLEESVDRDNLTNYLAKTIRKIVVVKEIIEPLPHGEWYVDVLTNLLTIETLVILHIDTHEEVRKHTFDSTNSLKFQIRVVENMLMKGE